MATYIYGCSKCGRRFELMGQGVDDSSAPCPCGAEAQRVFCSGLPAIRGETVGKSYVNSGVITKHGYMDLNLFQEAHAEVLEDSAKAGLEPPDFLQIAKEKVASGEAGPSRIAK
jgi:putative FmdB family regulatory protein